MDIGGLIFTIYTLIQFRWLILIDEKLIEFIPEQQFGVIFPIGQWNFCLTIASVRFSNRCRKQHGAMLLPGAQPYCLILYKKHFIKITTWKEYSARWDSYSVRLTWLIDMFEMPITRVVCKFDFLNVPSFATRCLKNIFLLLIHNCLKIDRIIIQRLKRFRSI